MKEWRIYGLVCFLSLSIFCGTGQGQERYPARPIELVVPFAPGGSSDIAARVYSDELGHVLKTTINVVNRAGGGGIQGAAYVARANRDGYTLMAGSGASIVLAPVLKKSETPYDSLKDFIPLGHFVSVPTVFAVKADAPFKTLQELADYARKNPGKIKCGLGGVGNDSHFNLEIFCSKAKIKITGIPFKSGGESVTALLGGHVDMASNTLAALGPHIQGGKLRGLCITAKTRDPDFANIPTTNELGYPDVNFNIWQGAFAPSGIPPSVLNILVPAFKTVFTNADLAKVALKAQFAVEYLGPEDFRKMYEEQIKTAEKIAEEAKLIGK
jgi:tripartite-type tricarboxylate transporter receptor subunit TctC